jgi:hypothetical protein
MGVTGIVIAAIIGACGPSSSSQSSGGSQPSRVEPVVGARTSRVVLTQQASGLLGIKTEVVRKAAKSSPQATLVPVAALVYEADGSVWVYTIGDASNAAGGTVTFLRVAVTVARIDGDSAELQSGPPAGTPVVTVGGAELLGTEYGVEGG